MMITPDSTGPIRRRQWLTVVLPLLMVFAVAFSLRVWNLTGMPPGLTHDEANHGREAIGILNGVFLYFFPLNYGSEPLYSYTVALSMALLGPGLLALRLVNVIFGLAAIAATYLWAVPRLGRSVALLGAALLAVSFWPLASSREALRVGMLPFFMVLAVWFFWRIVATPAGNRRPHALIWPIIGFGLSIALTLHIYLAARVSWLLFPAFLLYLGFFHRQDFRRVWQPVLAGLLLAGLLVIPMFLYLRAHPEMQTRLDMLGGSLDLILSGNWRPILINARDALLAFVWPGFGDQFLAYNIPGRPVFDAISAVFFVAGLAVCLRRWRQPVYTFLLLWFLTGIIPSLITGPTANTTRNMAALPAVYLIAAVGFIVSVGWLVNRLSSATNSHLSATHPAQNLAALLATAWVLWVAGISAYDYFIRWGDSPEVRGAYQHTLVTTLDLLQDDHPDAAPVIFSSVYPGPAHDSSIALVLAADRPALSRTARWVDARYGLALPDDQNTLIAIPSSTPAHPAFAAWLNLVEWVELRPDDLDPSFALYSYDRLEIQAALDSLHAVDPAAAFNEAVELIASGWLTGSSRPGETAELLTVWRVRDPARAGPVVPPSFTTDAVIFSHVLDPTGQILAQRDSLDVPSWAWHEGDLFVQIHPITVPIGTPSGEYRAVTGLYDRTSGARLPVGAADFTDVAPLRVEP